MIDSNKVHVFQTNDRIVLSVDNFQDRGLPFSVGIHITKDQAKQLLDDLSGALS